MTQGTSNRLSLKAHSMSQGDIFNLLSNGQSLSFLLEVLDIEEQGCTISGMQKKEEN